MSDKDCVIDKALTLLPAGLDRQSEDSCRILNRIKRLLVEIKEGKGTPGHLTALKSLARDLNLTGETVEPVGLSLLTLIEENRGSFLEHMLDKRCSSGVCFDYHPAPCQSACPAYIDIPTFVALIGQGRYEEATEVILQDNPFPWTCGLICPHPWEDACLRGEPVTSICSQRMKAYTA